MLQLYGNSRSRAMRCLWMFEEMGKPYQLIEKSTRADDLQDSEYLRLNPNARIPTLVDGDLVLWESMAINLYLAQKYEGPMHCPRPEVLGLAAQWSFWAMLETEALLLDLLNHRAVLPEFARDPSYAERDELLLKKPLDVLNGALYQSSERVTDYCPIASRDAHDLPGLVDECVPSVAAVVDDIVEGFENPIGQPILTHELPDVFLTVEFGCARRQRHERDVVGNHEGFSAMPAGLIKQQNGVRPWDDVGRDREEMGLHGFTVAGRQHESGAGSAFGADRTEQIGRLRPLIMGGTGA